jgi:hypothetical protein
MSLIATLIDWLQTTPLSTAIRESDLLFPIIECVHVIAFVTVLGAIAVVDLRLMGLMSKDRRIGELTEELLPITWIAFAITLVAGLLLFVSKPMTYTHNFFFLGKMVLLLLAAANMGVFHLFVQGRLADQQEGPPPWAARASGAASLALWITIVAFGRWIGFTTLG